MISHDERPFTPRLFTMPMRGTRDDAMNGFDPEINLADPEAPRFGSSDKDEPQRWVAVVLSELEMDLLLRLTEAGVKGWDLDVDTRYLAQNLSRAAKTCIEEFEGYEERKAKGQPVSLPVAS